MLQNRHAINPLFYSIILLAAIISSCHFKAQEVKEGEKLAKIHCGSCHRLPEPALLNKRTWANYVLPSMGRLIGFHHLPTGGYVEAAENTPLPLKDWNRLIAYYISEAPEQLQAPADKKKIVTGLKGFTPFIPVTPVRKPSTTFVGINEKQQGFYWGDGLLKKLYRAHADGRLLDSFPTETGIVQVQDDSAGIIILNMGLLYPSDELKGKLIAINRANRKQLLLIDSLQRPVHASFADLNNDKREDIIIAEFGNRVGSLGWYQNFGDNKYRHHRLRNLPGAVKTITGDYNRDGLPDLLALMAQGDEGIFIYYNQGKGNFREERVLQFPPTYGFNSIEAVDFNKDGFDDLMTTNGDNGDYPPLLKPYHGIRVYLNNGSNGFSEKVFLPVNGVGKAMAKDFDADGDLDIASIAYFPDYDHNPDEGFVYWENTGNWSYQPYTFPQVTAGRWLTMDAGDLDADGDIDIILGNAYFSLGYLPEDLKKRWDKYSPSVIVLKNNLY